MNREEFKSMKLGMVMKHIPSQSFHILLATSEQFVLTFNTYEGILHYFDLKTILKEFVIAKSRDYRSLISNINTKLSLSTNFLQGAIKLFQENPIAYKECMKNIDDCNDELAYLSDSKLEESRLVVDSRTNKTYTISEVMNIGNKLLFRLVRHAMVYGQIMDSEIINVSKNEFDKFFTFLNDKETKEQEEIDLSLDIPDNFSYERNPIKIKPLEQFITLFKDLPRMPIRSLKRLDELIKTDYLDVFFPNKLYNGISFLTRENFISNEIVVTTIHETQGNIFKITKSIIYKDKPKHEIITRYCSALDLYSDICTLYDYDEDSNEENSILDGYVERDQNTCMFIEKRAYDRKNNTFVELTMDDENRLIYKEDGRDIQVCIDMFPNIKKSLYVNRFCSVSRAKDELEEVTDIFKLGNTIVYNEILPLVIYEVKEKTISVFVNFFKDHDKDLIKLSIPKNLINLNKKHFKFYPELSFYSFRL